MRPRHVANAEGALRTYTGTGLSRARGDPAVAAQSSGLACVESTGQFMVTRQAAVSPSHMRMYDDDGRPPAEP